MSEDKSKGIGPKAIVAGAAIGSAAVAAALLFASKRKKSGEAQVPPSVPTGEAPETD